MNIIKYDRIGKECFTPCKKRTDVMVGSYGCWICKHHGGKVSEATIQCNYKPGGKMKRMIAIIIIAMILVILFIAVDSRGENNAPLNGYTSIYAEMRDTCVSTTTFLEMSGKLETANRTIEMLNKQNGRCRFQRDSLVMVIKMIKRGKK